MHDEMSARFVNVDAASCFFFPRTNVTDASSIGRGWARLYISHHTACAAAWRRSRAVRSGLKHSLGNVSSIKVMLRCADIDSVELRFRIRIGLETQRENVRGAVISLFLSLSHFDQILLGDFHASRCVKLDASNNMTQVRFLYEISSGN